MSDMQFNAAAGTHSFSYDITTMHHQIKKRFTEVGALLKWEDTSAPPIVYWNLRNTGGHLVVKDEEGAVLLSGFSPSLLKLVLQGNLEQEVEVVNANGTTKTEKIRVTPEKMLYKMLDDELYNPASERDYQRQR